MAFVGQHVGDLERREQRRIIKRHRAKPLTLLNSQVILHGFEHLQRLPGELVMPIKDECDPFVWANIDQLGHMFGHELEFHRESEQIWLPKAGMPSLFELSGHFLERLQVDPADEPDRLNRIDERNESFLELLPICPALESALPLLSVAHLEFGQAGFSKRFHHSASSLCHSDAGASQPAMHKSRCCVPLSSQ